MASSSNEPCTSTRVNTSSSTTSSKSILRSGENNVSQCTSSSNCGNSPSDEVVPSNLVDSTSNVQKISNSTRQLFDSQRYSTDHELVDVIFVFDGAKLGAHKFILLDGHVNAFFHKHLVGRKGVIVIDVPSGISFVSIDALLSYMYGKPFDQLEITEDSIDGFLKAAMFFKMDVLILQKLQPDFNDKVQDFVALNFREHLSANSEFWNMENKTILQLCQSLRPEEVEDSFLDWISSDKPNRKQHLIKLLELRHLIAFGIDNLDPSDNEEPNSNPSASIESQETSSAATIPNQPRQNYLQNPSPSEVPVNPIEPRRTLRRRLKSGDENSVSRTTTEAFDTQPPKKVSKVIAPPESETKKPRTAARLPRSASGPTKKRKVTPRKTHQKANSNGMDGFFKHLLQDIRENLEKRTCNKNFMDSWTTIWHYTGGHEKIKGAPRRKNMQRFTDGGGLELLLQSRKIFPNLDNPDFIAILLDIIHGLFRISPTLIFTNEILELLLKDLQNYDKIYDTTKAGIILSDFLEEYGSDGWVLEISREHVSTLLRDAIVNHWDISLEIGQHMDFETFLDYVDLIVDTNPVVNLCGLWFLTYYTLTDTNSLKRNEEGNRNLRWLQEANWDDCLEELTRHNDENISTYSENLLNRLNHAPSSSRNVEAKKASSNHIPLGFDDFFNRLLDDIRENLVKRTSNKKFTTCWEKIGYYTGIGTDKSRYKNLERLLANGGLELLLESRKHFSEKDAPGLSSTLLDIIDGFCQSFPNSVYRDEVIEHLLMDLQNYDTDFNSVTAGEILAYFLTKYETEDWDLDVSRELVSSKLREAVVGHWDFKVDKQIYIDNIEDFRSVIDGIFEMDQSVILFGLWNLTYFTLTDTNSEKRNELGRKNLYWLQEVNCSGILEELADHENKEISTYAKNLLNRSRKIAEITTGTRQSDSDKAPSTTRRPRSNLLPERIDNLFKFIREGLASSTYEEDFIDSWRAIYYYTARKEGTDKYFSKKCKRFLDCGGLELLLESRKSYPYMDEGWIYFLEIIDTLYEAFPDSIFRNEVIDHLVRDLKKYDQPYVSVLAGVLLTHILTYGETEDWNLEISREEISSEVHGAIIEQWDLRVDKNSYILDAKEFNRLIDLILKMDPTVNLCGLWNITYSTLTDTNSDERNEEGRRNLQWLKEANCEGRLKELADSKDEYISKYAKDLLIHMREDQN